MKKVVCAVIEAVIVLVAGVVAVAAHLDIRVGYLLIKGDAFEGALKIVVHQGFYAVSSIVLVVAVHGSCCGWRSCWRAG